MTPAQLAAKIDRIRQALPVELAIAQKKVGAKAVTIAQKWSSGTTTSAELASDGHPYAIRNGGNGSPLINRQTKKEGSPSFFGGWYYDPAAKALVNRTPYGPDLQYGTPTMVGRDILGAIRKEIKPIMRAEYARAIKRSFRA